MLCLCHTHVGDACTPRLCMAIHLDTACVGEGVCVCCFVTDVLTSLYVPGPGVWKEGKGR